MKGLHWLMSWIAVAPALMPAEVEESRREREAASRHHARSMRHLQSRALDLIDRQEGGAPPMDAIEAMLRGEPKR